MATIVETSCFGNLQSSDDPKVLVIPTPYEYSTPYLKGTKNGPQAILNASMHLEFFDDELWTDISTIGINTTNLLTCEFVNNKTKEPFIEVEKAVRNAVISGCLPVVIGGEHSISCGSIKAIYDLYPDVSILYFNAKPCLMDTFQSNKYNHQCTLRRVCELMPDLKIVQLGIRSISQEEAKWVETNDTNVEIYFAKDKKLWTTAEIISSLSKNVYISFDFNTLDSSIMPSCTMPEPGGLSFEQATDIIKNICAFKEIVGIDFTDFSPITGLSAPDFLAAKLIYKSIGYAFARQLGVFEEESSLVTNKSL